MLMRTSNRMNTTLQCKTFFKSRYSYVYTLVYSTRMLLDLITSTQLVRNYRQICAQDNEIPDREHATKEDVYLLFTKRGDFFDNKRKSHTVAKDGLIAWSDTGACLCRYVL